MKWLVLVIALGGCGIGIDESTGELGRAEFAWDDGALGCLFGCDAGEPMVEGGFARLRVTNSGDLPPYTTAVDDGALVDASGVSTITLEAGGPGSGKVLLEGTDGELVDRFRIDVAAVERIELNNPDLYRERLTVIAGYGVQVSLDLVGDGEYLKGYGAIDYQLSGGLGEQQISLVSALADAIIGVLVGTNNEYARVDATAVGAGEIRAIAPSGVELTIPVEVITEADITGVELAQDQPLAAGSGESAFVDARFFAGDEIAQGGECAWSIDPEDGPIAASFGTKSASFSATAPASATVRCEIDGEVATLTLSAD